MHVPQLETFPGGWSDSSLTVGGRDLSAVPPRPRADGAFALETKARREVLATLDELATDVEQLAGTRLRAILLVGDAAREEWGWIMGPHGLVPHGEVALVAVVDRGASGLRRPLADLARRHGTEHGFTIRLTPTLASSLAPPPPTLAWLDVALGARRVLWGSEADLQLAEVPVDRVSRDEGSYLLARHASRLAATHLARTPDSPQVLHGQLHDAVLACGAAILLGGGRYRARHEERLVMLSRSADLATEAFTRAYADALRFRERPDRWHPDVPVAEFVERRLGLVTSWHLRFERNRAGTPLDPAGFAEWPRALYSLADLPPLPRAFYRAARFIAGPRTVATMHPRERWARASVALAYEPRDPRARAAACRLLGVDVAASNEHLAAALERARAHAGLDP